MDLTSHPTPPPIPTPAEFLATHPHRARWSSGTYDEYDTALIVAGNGGDEDPNGPWLPKIPKPRPGKNNATANHSVCPGCHKPITGRCPRCDTPTRILVAAGHVHHGGTIGLTGRIQPRAVAAACGLLADTERTLDRRNVHGTRRWRLTLRAQAARALVLAGGGA